MGIRPLAPNNLWKMARGMFSVELHYKSSTCGQTGMTEGRAMPQAVSRRPIIADAWVQCQASPYGNRGGHSGTGNRFLSEYITFRTYSSVYHLRCIVSAIEGFV